ncbi:integrin alpha-PS1 isoform X2 [Leptopilina heterotoma]|uniref:integrin alpha-PS1 isoform X2 n=1 Tax=Leptopilina heterotoma TaxID=63436 RepID=UPI001CA8C547|nr:integrin alpha-PS1 isoform X2 [Leptopilina heterotoma]
MYFVKMQGGIILCLVLSILSSVNSFNLEARIPVIKKGVKGSYFGFSVAEHQEISEKNGDKTSWILVGAPLDQNIQPGTNRSGALWKCPLTSTLRDCQQVITDGQKSIDSEELIPPGNDEVKDNQWLGVTVRSQGPGGKVMVCAHRHIVKSKDSMWGQGQCYVLWQDLKVKDLKKPCSGKPTDKAHEQFGYCLAGTSGLLTSEEYVMIGTPGPYTWQGTVYLSTVEENFFERDNTIYNAPMQDASPVKKYSYLGMSVAVGNFFKNGLAYAAGAPRSNETGQVVLFVRNEGKADLQVITTLDGEQLGSSFGYEIASADVNGDKISDLFVAAPFYFNKGEGGAVYVYTSLEKNMKVCKKCAPTKLVGKEESRFGFAIANLGDLNQDGYEDIAIGAPYEGKGTVYIYLGSRNGLITVPSQVIHSEDTPVPLRTFGYSLSGGIDMDQNGYPDLLVGAYDDAAVALLRSRNIINITTYIQYYKKDGLYQEKIESIDPSKPGCFADPLSNYTCFSFEACCETRSVVKREGKPYLKLNYFIEAETYSGVKKFSRVWFRERDSRSHIIHRQIILDSSKRVHCQSETVYLKENTRDIQSPIKFRLNYTLIQEEPAMPREGSPLPDIKNFPILNQQEAAKVFEATFQKDCGENDICESDLRIKAALDLKESLSEQNFYELTLRENADIAVNVTIKNIGESAYEAQLFVEHSSNLNYIGTKTNDSVICNVHNTTIVACSLGNPFKKDKIVFLQVRFDPTKLEDHESQLTFKVFANSTSKEVSEKSPTYLQAAIIRRAELSIKGTSKSQWAYYGGPVIGESAIKNLHEIGPKVFHIYEVFNEGPWRVSALDVKIRWPYEVANDKPHGKWLLYLEDIPSVQAQGTSRNCEVAPGYVNPLKLQGSVSEIEPLVTTSYPLVYNNTNYIRRRRDTEKVVNTRTYIKDGRRHQIVHMSCKGQTAKCIDIICRIENLQRKKEAIVTIKARLWNSTLAEDYRKVDEVRIASYAKIIIPAGVIIQQENVSDDFTIAETVAYPDISDQQEPEPVPIWIIVGAILAGLLLLILLTLILWKLGFFKRRRPDPTLSGNLEKHRDDNPEHEALFKN